jgi:predicted nucleic acid-binding Zn ribbon protein
MALSRLRARELRGKILAMAVYVYETIPTSEGQAVRTYEIRQSMRDAALTKHPETGEPIKRVITGGLGVMTSSKGGAVPRPATGGACCGGGCGCH